MKEHRSYWAWVFAKMGGAALSEELPFELSAVEWRYEGQSWEEECVKALRVKKETPYVNVWKDLRKLHWQNQERGIQRGWGDRKKIEQKWWYRPLQGIESLFQE